jgi:heat shock protein HslJ
MKALMMLISTVVVAATATAGTLPQGRWRLEEYKFKNATEHTRKGVDTILIVKADGKLGGSTGCNAYGGSYAMNGGKLKITDIISTMRACEEPTPEFEKGFFDTLERATSAEVKGGTLMIRDLTGTFLRFTPDDK